MPLPTQAQHLFCMATWWCTPVVFQQVCTQGRQPPFFQRLPLFEGVALPKRKAASFLQRIPADFKTPLQAFFPKAATFLLWPPSDFFPIAAFFAKAVGLLCFHVAFFPKAIAAGILLKALPNLPQLPQNQGTLGSPAFWPTGASPNKC